MIAGIALVAAFAIFRLWVHGSGFDWKAFFDTFSHLDWGWLVLSCVLGYATYYGRALRWAVFLAPLRPKAGIWNLTKATLIGFTAVILLGRPGEIVRPYLISVKEGVPLSSQLAAWFLERILDLLFVLMAFGYGLSCVRSSQAHVGAPLQWAFRAGGNVAWVLAVICLTLLILLSQFPALFRQRLVDALGFLHERHLEKVENWIGSFLVGVESLRSLSSIVRLIGYSFLEWLLIAGCYFCAVKSFGGVFEFGVVDVLIYMGFVAFGSVIQLPGIGGGMQVVSVLVLHEIFGIPLETATSVTLLLWIITAVVILPAGLLLAFHEGISFNRMKKIREASPL